MSRTGANGEEESRRNRLTVWTLSGMTDLGHFRLSPDAIGWCISPQFGRLPLRAWVKPLRPRVKVTQARNGMCLKYTGRAHPSTELRSAKPDSVKWTERCSTGPRVLPRIVSSALIRRGFGPPEDGGLFGHIRVRLEFQHGRRQTRNGSGIFIVQTCCRRLCGATPCR